MLQGIHLTLLIGPAVPVPAPQSVMDALQSVQVTSSRDTSGFQITFSVSKQSPLLTTAPPTVEMTLRVSPGRTLLHLVNHGTPHRGQVMGMIRQLGITPPGTDLMHYYMTAMKASSL